MERCTERQIINGYVKRKMYTKKDTKEDRHCHAMYSTMAVVCLLMLYYTDNAVIGEGCVLAATTEDARMAGNGSAEHSDEDVICKKEDKEMGGQDRSAVITPSTSQYSGGML